MDAKEVAASVVADVRAGALRDRDGAAAALAALLESRSVTRVDVSGWRRIDAVERERGERRGAPREKMLRIDEMLAVATK